MAPTARRGQLVPGRSWAAWSRALGLLLPPLDVVDLGCGEGYLAIEAAQWARRVVAIDRAPEVLAHARAFAARRRVDNIVWKRGEIERVPLPDTSADVVLLSQALHHAADPARALAEAFRLLRPGGRVLVLDLRDHGEQWVRRKLGDVWQGFAPERLRALLQQAGFRGRPCARGRENDRGSVRRPGGRGHEGDIRSGPPPAPAKRPTDEEDVSKRSTARR